MLNFASQLKIFAYTRATDMRKGFAGLSSIVREEFEADPTDGSLFVFINRRRTHIKLLVWDRNGFVIYYKRLEKGSFEIPASGTLSWHHLVLMLEDISIGDGTSPESARYRKRYSRPETSEKAA